jgi:hypothetical protein
VLVPSGGLGVLGGVRGRRESLEGGDVGLSRRVALRLKSACMLRYVDSKNVLITWRGWGLNIRVAQSAIVLSSSAGS